MLYSTNKSLPANYLGTCSINCMMVSIPVVPPRSQPLRRDMISLAFMHIHMCHAHPHKQTQLALFVQISTGYTCNLMFNVHL